MINKRFQLYMHCFAYYLKFNHICIQSWTTTGTSKKNINIMKKVNVFCHSFHNVKPIYYIDSLHRVKYFKPLFLEFLMIMAYR